MRVDLKELEQKIQQRLAALKKEQARLQANLTHISEVEAVARSFEPISSSTDSNGPAQRASKADDLIHRLNQGQ